MTRQGPVLIAYDGSPSSRHALQEAGPLLAGNAALVLTVWKQGLAFELLEPPGATLGLPPAPLDIRSALELDRELYEAAQRAAEEGAQLARDAGFADAEPLVVAEEVEVPVAETIVSIADERDVRAIVVGAHAHGRLDEIILGSTSRDVIRRAQQPVLVAPEPRRNKKTDKDAAQRERTAARG
jgi:nucleotide-binding universal stress UspA family protein